MTPAPSRMLQRILLDLATTINNYLKGSNSGCEIYDAPFDVRFCEEDDDNGRITNVVQPSIV